MSPVDAYLADLRAALGDRLPPALKEARLRETRGHLLMAAQDTDEREAVRRYGRPRAVANGFVRAHHGYDGRSVWRLAFPLTGAFLLYGASEVVAKMRFPRQSLPHYGVLSAEAFTALLFSLGFVLRVAQTRRWLAGPMIAAQAATILLLGCMELAKPRPISTLEILHVGIKKPRTIVSRHWGFGPVVPKVPSRDEVADLAWKVYEFGVLWATLNTAALGLAALSDRRRVRRA